MDTVKRRLAETDKWKNYTSLTAKEIVDLLTLALKNSFFQVRGKLLSSNFQVCNGIGGQYGHCGACNARSGDNAISNISGESQVVETLC